jgi:uncharacterized protein YjbJ (UPF0337 family)
MEGEIIKRGDSGLQSTRRFPMGDGDKDRIEGAEDKLEGDVKETVGKLADDHKLEIEGKADNLKGDVKDGIADVKDKVGDIFHKKDD